MAEGIGTFEIERTVPMVLYHLSKRGSCLAALFIILSAGTMVTTVIFGPPIISSIIVTPPASNMVESQLHRKNETLQTLEVDAPLPGRLMRYNRQVWITASFQVSDNAFVGVPTAEVPVDFFIKMHCTHDIVTTSSNSSNSQNSSDITTTTTTVEEDLLIANTSRILSCYREGGRCRRIELVHFVRIPEGSLHLSFQAQSFAKVTVFALEFHIFNPIVTTVEMWMHVGFLALTFILACFFSYSMRHYRLTQWTIEQKWTSILIIALIFFNDPLFGVSILAPPDLHFYYPVDTISFAFQSVYGATLMTFWLVVFQGLRKNARPFCRFYLPKLLIVIPVWILAIVAYGLIFQEFAEQPASDISKVLQKLFPIGIAIVSLLGVYILAIFYLLLRCCLDRLRLPYFGERIKFVVGSICCLLLISVALFLLSVLLSSDLSVVQWIMNPLLLLHSSSLIAIGLPTLINMQLGIAVLVYRAAAPNPETSWASAPLLIADSCLDSDDDDDEDIVYDSKARTPSKSVVGGSGKSSSSRLLHK